MKKRILLTVVLLFVTSIVLFAADNTDPETAKKSIDWVEIMFAGGYLIGVFILLPIVIYTNLHEKLFVPSDKNRNEIQPIDASESERNAKATEILETIESKLTPFKADDGSDMITITNGRQARLVKRGLDYINKRLCPTDAAIIDRTNEFSEVYNHRAKRAFTGSYWIIACSAGVGLLLTFTAGISVFLFIHFLGLLFYILSSRTTLFAIEKRMKYFGNGTGIIAAIMTALVIGDGTKYYIKENGGSWKRDWETEGNMAIVGLIILVVVALILGFLAAFLGVINFIFNYSTSFILPFKSDDKWYEEKFVLNK